MANSTLIILFSEMLKFLKLFYSKNNFFVPSERDHYESGDEASVSLPRRSQESKMHSPQQKPAKSVVDTNKASSRQVPASDLSHAEDVLIIHDDDEDDLDHIVKGLK